MKKLVLFISMVLLFGSPLAALAAVPTPDPNIITYSWIDRADILRSDGLSFLDSNSNDSTNVYIAQSDPNKVSCNFAPSVKSEYQNGGGASLLDTSAMPDTKPGTATLVYFTLPTSNNNTNCVEHQIRVALQSTDNAPIKYDWKDSGTIVRVGDGGETYTLDSTSGLYVLNSGTSCHPYFTVGQNTTVGTLTNVLDHSPVSSGGGRGGVLPSAPYKQVNGCYVEQSSTQFPLPTFKLGTLNNRSLPPSSPGAGSTGAAATDNCDAGGGLTWLICGIITGALKAVDGIREHIIQPLLHVDPLIATDPTTGKATPIYALWSAFRSLADIFFILLFFVVIFGTAYGLDNYTVKKILPRLIAAAILVQFSFVITGVLIDIGNVVGAGLDSLSRSIIPVPTFDFTGGGAKVGALAGLFAGVGLALSAAIGLSFATVLGALVAMLLVVFTLLLRQILITVLVVLAPFAFIAWVLPNTESLFKHWWRNLLRTILLYPLIILMFIAGRIFAASALAGTGDFKNVFGLAGYILPLFLIPTVFVAAGKIMSIGGGLLKKAGGAADGKFGKTSDMAKRNAEARRANNALRATNEDKTAFGRAVARKRGGFGGIVAPMTPGQKRTLQSSSDRALSDRVAAEAVTIGRMPLSTDSDISALGKIARDKDQGKAIAAIQRLAITEKGRQELRGVRASLGGDNLSGQSLVKWDTAVSGDTAKTLLSKSPDLVKTATGAFRNISAQEVANWDGATAKAAAGYLGGLDRTNPEHQEIISRASAAVASFAASDRLKTVADANVAKELQANGQVLSSAARTALSNNFEIDGSQKTSTSGTAPSSAGGSTTATTLWTPPRYGSGPSTPPAGSGPQPPLPTPPSTPPSGGSPSGGGPTGPAPTGPSGPRWNPSSGGGAASTPPVSPTIPGQSSTGARPTPPPGQGPTDPFTGTHPASGANTVTNPVGVTTPSQPTAATPYTGQVTIPAAPVATPPIVQPNQPSSPTTPEFRVVQGGSTRSATNYPLPTTEGTADITATPNPAGITLDTASPSSPYAGQIVLPNQGQSPSKSSVSSAAISGQIFTTPDSVAPETISATQRSETPSYSVSTGDAYSKSASEVPMIQDAPSRSTNPVGLTTRDDRGGNPGSGTITLHEAPAPEPTPIPKATANYTVTPAETWSRTASEIPSGPSGAEVLAKEENEILPVPKMKTDSKPKQPKRRPNQGFSSRPTPTMKPSNKPTLIDPITDGQSETSGDDRTIS